MVKSFSEYALKALMYEVAVSPKPGLVDRYNAGAHKDMDFFTFIDSSVALMKYFEAIEAKVCAIVKTKVKDADIIFDAIQPLGFEAQQIMFAETGGVNTHKGAIYALGLNLAATCEVYHRHARGSELAKIALIRQRISEYVAPTVRKELSRLGEDQTMTYGLDQFVKYGLLGARGEAMQGYPTVFEVGLPVLNSALTAGLSLNDAAVEVLLEIIRRLDDSNVIGRRGLEVLKESQKMASEVLSAGAMRTEDGKNALFAYDNWCIEQNISHGGAADLMAVVLFHHFVSQKKTNR